MYKRDRWGLVTEFPKIVTTLFFFFIQRMHQRFENNWSNVWSTSNGRACHLSWLLLPLFIARWFALCLVFSGTANCKVSPVSFFFNRRAETQDVAWWTGHTSPSPLIWAGQIIHFNHAMQSKYSSLVKRENKNPFLHINFEKESLHDLISNNWRLSLW